MTAFPSRPLADLPSVTAQQMRVVDELMVGEFGIDLVRMMENAGRALADVAVRRYEPRSVAVLAGTGGNGGGGLVAARHLANRGVSVSVSVTDDTALGPVPGEQLTALRRLGVEPDPEPQRADVVIDALVGYSLRGALSGRAERLADWANAQREPTLALDLPSGLDATSGRIAGTSVEAEATVTLALVKRGLVDSPVVGCLYLADISVPARLWARLDVPVPRDLFAVGQVLELTRPEAR